ncbi:unnamed protein product [Pleuronectes platessa]|uniref:Uncharacterized protein n=1 Tax=Pleuronectes platessa TaxID=8262 RepID=A0A9N7VXK9_PLEPL|nr:unnamed protein product [Pleuronectes platessa]
MAPRGQWGDEGSVTVVCPRLSVQDSRFLLSSSSSGCGAMRKRLLCRRRSDARCVKCAGESRGTDRRQGTLHGTTALRHRVCFILKRSTLKLGGEYRRLVGGWIVR